jgi:hypothetical protein
VGAADVPSACCCWHLDVSARAGQDGRMRTGGSLSAIALAVALLGTTAGCSTGAEPSVLDDEQVAADALPGGDQEALRTMVPESSRLLGDAEGNRWWAATNDAGEFCLVKQEVGAGAAASPSTEPSISGCGGDERGGMALEGADGVRATWSSTPDPDVPDGSSLLRDRLVVTPAP